jgi:molybdenum cofactor cytidylyltransferase
MPRHFAIVPAAGASTRMGSQKLLLPWGRGVVLERVLEAWMQAGLDQTLIILSSDEPRLHHIASRFAVDIIVPERRPADMKASVQLALDRLTTVGKPADDDAWLLAPADVPEISSEVIRQLVLEYDRSPGMAIVPMHDGRRGHPLVLPWWAAALVAELGPTQGIRDLLPQIHVRELNILDAAMPEDLDTPEDYVRLYNRHHPND